MEVEEAARISVRTIRLRHHSNIAVVVVNAREIFPSASCRVAITITVVAIAVVVYNDNARHDSPLAPGNAIVVVAFAAIVDGIRRAIAQRWRRDG